MVYKKILRKHIVLTGYMGCGKSTIGRKLAEILNIPFVDLDEYISVYENLSINEIFREKGEIYFRKLENEILKNLISSNEGFKVIALGGGTVCYSNNHLYLQDENVESFYLKTNIHTLIKRLEVEKHNRPLIAHVEDLYSFVGPHLFEREYYYRFAKHIINTENKNIGEICNEISNLI